MTVLLAILAGLYAGQTDAPYAPTYENAVQCTGIIARIASTTGDQAANVELTAVAASLAAQARRLAVARGIAEPQVRLDLGSAWAAGEQLIPNTSQQEWTRAMREILPVAQNCLALNQALATP